MGSTSAARRAGMEQANAATRISVAAEAASWITLPTSAAAKLTVNPARLMPLSANDVKATGRSHTRTKLDIGPSTSHICGNGYCSGLTSMGNNLSLFFVPLGVKN